MCDADWPGNSAADGLCCFLPVLAVVLGTMHNCATVLASLAEASLKVQQGGQHESTSIFRKSYSSLRHSSRLQERVDSRVPSAVAFVSSEDFL